MDKIKTTKGIDSAIGGGFNRQSTSIVVGSVASGKTSVSLILALEAQKNGANVLYLPTEENTKNIRRKILESKYKDVVLDVRNLNNQNFLKELEKILTVQNKDLIVIDSAQLPIQFAEGNESAYGKSQIFLGRLYDLSRIYNCAIITSGQSQKADDVFYEKDNYISALISENFMGIKKVEVQRNFWYKVKKFFGFFITNFMIDILKCRHAKPISLKANLDPKTLTLKIKKNRF